MESNDAEKRTICSKSEFARARGRSPKQVTDWLQRGIITPAALVGEGHRARIWVEQADRDIAAHMRPGSAAQLDTGAPTPVADSEDAKLLRRRRKADAEHAEMRAEQARRQLAADDGRWIEREAAERAWAKQLQEIISRIEVWASSTLPQDIAADIGGDWKLIASSVRKSFRQHREAEVKRLEGGST